MDSIHLPNTIALPNAFGAPGTPLPPGQVVQALVLALIESDVFRLQLPQAVVDVRSDVPLTPGSTITLAVKSGGTNPRFVVYSDAPPAAAPATQGTPSLAGRTPIGEAVVVARVPAPAQGGALAPGPLALGRSAEQPTIHAPSISPARVPPIQPERPAVAVTPEQAVAEAVRVAAPRQAGLAPLFADVERTVQVANVLPAPVRAAAASVLSLRVPLDERLTAPDIKQAFVRSGVLFEPRLAAQTARAADADILTPSPASDLKAALLVLRQVLKIWVSDPAPRAAASVTAAAPAPREPLVRPTSVPAYDAAIKQAGARLDASSAAPQGMIARPAPVPPSDAIKHLVNALAGAPEEPMPAGAPLSPEQATTLAKAVATAFSGRDAPSQPAATQNGPPPPYRGAPLSAQPQAAPSITPDTAPREIADRLIAQTDGALARQTLLQVASLPDQPDLPRAEATQRWTFEIPFATPQGTSIAQFEVSRDGRTAKSDPQARIWRARFSLDVEPMGPVHALIALAGERASMTLWAERASSAARLSEHAPLLSEALRAAELEPADFQLRVGVPPAARHAAPGRFMDRAT